MLAGAVLAWRLSDALLAYEIGLRVSTQRLLFFFAAVSGATVLLQVCARAPRTATSDAAERAPRSTPRVSSVRITGIARVVTDQL